MCVFKNMFMFSVPTFLCELKEHANVATCRIFGYPTRHQEQGWQRMKEEIYNITRPGADITIKGTISSLIMNG